MNFNPVEGVHYIRDRYAFLNGVMDDGGHDLRLTDESPEDDIRRAIKLALALCHADRFTHLGRKKQEEAEQQRRLVQDCEEILLNPERRKVYNARLQNMRAETPDLISDGAHAIVSLSRTFFNMASLLSPDAPDISGHESKASQMTAHDPEDVAEAAEKYHDNPGNARAKKAYRTALTRQLIHLTVMEEAAWAKIGVLGRAPQIQGPLLYSDQYAEKMETVLQDFSARAIDAALENHALSRQIGFEQPAALLPAAFNEAAEGDGRIQVRQPEDEAVFLSRAKTVARENLEHRAATLRDMARQKQDVLEKLVALSDTETLHPGTAQDTVYDFYLLEPRPMQSPQVLLCLTLDVARHKADVEVFSDAPVTLADLQKDGFRRPAIGVTRNPEITDMLLEVNAAATRFMAAHLSSPPPSSTPDAPKI